MPPYLPLHPELVYVSGVCEIVLGALLLIRKWSSFCRLGVNSFASCPVFPANIYAYQHQELNPAPPLLHLLRLPLQGVLILWAYWYTGPKSATPR